MEKIQVPCEKEDARSDTKRHAQCWIGGANGRARSARGGKVFFRGKKGVGEGWH